ncbi:MAG: translation initiation factor IF-3 [Minisyncoccales bacterium]
MGNFRTRVQLPPLPLFKNNLKKFYLINNQIKKEKVRVIDEEGKNLGILELKEALKLAESKGKDLILITEKGDFPVCKIENYGKFLYQLRKKENKQKIKKGQLKILRLSLNISDHDLETKVNQGERLLKKEYLLRIEMRLKGRGKMFKEVAKEKVEKFLKMISERLKIKIEESLKTEPFGFSFLIKKDEKS